MNEPLLTSARGADGRSIRGAADPFVRPKAAETAAKACLPPLAAPRALAG